MPIMNELMSLASGCFVDNSAGKDRPTWITIDVEGEDERNDHARGYDSSLEVSAAPFSCMPEVGRCKPDILAAPVLASKKRRGRVSFSDDLDVLMFRVAEDGSASQELTVAKDVAISEPPSQQKKQKKRASFSSEAETKTFEVFTDMTPTRDMCDEVLLKLQEEQNQKETKNKAVELPASEKNAAVKTTEKSKARERRVSFEAEPEILSYKAAEEECDADVQDVVARPSAASESVHWNLQVLMKDASKITIAPSARPYLLNMRSLIGENPAFVVGRTSDQEDDGPADEHCDTTMQVLDQLLVASKARLDTHMGTTAAATKAEIEAQVSSISKVLAMYKDQIVRRHLGCC